MRSRAARRRAHRFDLIWTDRALRDLQAIDAYISADNPGAAARWIAKILAAAEQAAHLLGPQAPPAPLPLLLSGNVTAAGLLW